LINDAAFSAMFHTNLETGELIIVFANHYARPASYLTQAFYQSAMEIYASRDT
jgi:hypothetical protein